MTITSLSSKKSQESTKYHMIPPRMLILKRLTTASDGKGLEHFGALNIPLMGMFKNPFRKMFDNFLIKLILIKLNIYLPRDVLLSICKRNENICPQRDLYINVHGSYIYNGNWNPPKQMTR